MNIHEQIEYLGKEAKKASRELVKSSPEDITNAFYSLSKLLKENEEKLIEENKKDVEQAKKNGLSIHNQKRLELTKKVIHEMTTACQYVANYPHPINIVEEQWQRPNGLVVGKMRIPLGVIGIIYESRPNVTIDAAILCLRAGNAVVLRGGSEAIHTNIALAKLLKKALKENSLPESAVQFIETTDRQAVNALCKLHQYIDVLIPRGGEKLIDAVTEQATMPVLKHFKGVCHLFVEKTAKQEESIDIILNSKVQNPSACNALETLLIETSIAQDFLKSLLPKLTEAKVELKLCSRSYVLAETLNLLHDNIKKAKTEDFGQEFHSLTLAIKLVDTYNDAIKHIEKYGSNHTECICTQDIDMSRNFQKDIDASLVLINSSTRFNDGGQLGLGAEIGISTSKLHSYGVMGIKELTTTKYVAQSNYAIRD